MIDTARSLALAMLLAAASTAATAAPNIPPSELPGRDRLRFQDSPLDRFSQPAPKSAPLWQWQCDRPKNKGRKHERNASRRCP
jgi:hypothetical protein